MFHAQPQTLVLYPHRIVKMMSHSILSWWVTKWSLKKFSGDHWGQIEIMATAEGARNIRQPQVPIQGPQPQVPIQYFYGGFPNGP